MGTAHPELSTTLEPAAVDRIHFGPFRLEPAHRKLWRGSEVIAVAPKAFDLLVVLATSRGSVVEKDELMRRLWPDTFVSDESITQCVSALRRVLGDDPTHPQFIATIPKRGYRFVVPVTEEPSAADSTRPSEVVRRLHPVGALTPAPAATRRLDLWHWSMPQLLSGLAALAVAVVATWALSTRGSTPAAPMRFTEQMPVGTVVASGGVLSSDGQHLAYLARNLDTRTIHLWVRKLTGTAPRLLAGTAGAARPFWSPDGKGLGFFSDGKLRPVDLATGSIQTLATVGPLPVGGSWSPRGVIIFADRRSNLFAVPAAGGTPYPVTTLNREEQESAHRYPYFLPDGDHFLYYANSADPNRAGTFLTSLSSPAPRRVLDASSGGTIYVEPGWLIHVKDRQLLAEPFDVSAQRVTGDPRALASDVNAPLVTNPVVLSAASTGVISYGGGHVTPRLVWYDVTGRRLGAVTTELHNPALSHDGLALLASNPDPDRRGVWLVNDGSAPQWLLREAISPLGSPDGRHVFFTSNRVTGIQDIYSRAIGGSDDTLLFRSNEPKAVTDVTNDGRYLVFTSSNPKTKEDVWMLPLAKPDGARPFLQTEYNEMQGEVSPDGQWIAYASDESGRWEVYLQRFPSGGWKRTISTEGGAEPHWRQDSKRLFYLSGDERVMAVDVIEPATGQLARPLPLFRVPLSTDLPTIFRNQFAVSPDGTRFIIDASEGPVDPINVLVNWTSVAN